MSLFIDIEGIDASGKTAVSCCIKKVLEERGYSVDLLSKKEPYIDKPEIALYLRDLSALVWNKNPRVFPKEFLSGDAWALQLALWFKVLHENCVLPNKSEIVLVDGWYYKYYARLLQNSQNNRDLVEVLLDTLNTCTYVFCLDVAPETCWSRRKEFKLTETAPFGEIPNDPKMSFIKFQGAILDVLKSLGNRYRNWDIIDGNARNLEEIVLEIVKKIEVLINDKRETGLYYSSTDICG